MTEQLIEGLSKVVKIAGKESTIFIRADKSLTVAGYSDHHSAVYRAPLAEGSQEFDIALDPNAARQILNNFPQAEFRVEDNLFIATQGKDEATFALTLDRPRGQLNPPKNFQGTKVDPMEFNRMFQEVKYTSNNPLIGDIRFKGFHLTQRGRVLETMASDGAIVAVSSSTVAEDGEDFVVITNPEFFLVADAVKEADVLEMGLSDKRMNVKAGFPHGIMYVASVIIVAEPLDYAPIIKAASTNPVLSYRVDRRDLIATLSKVAYFTDEVKRQRILLEFSGDDCTISADNDRGRGSVSMKMTPMHEEGEDMSLAVSWKYLQSVISATKHETIFLHLKGPASPVFVDTQATYTAVLTVFTK